MNNLKFLIATLAAFFFFTHNTSAQSLSSTANTNIVVIRTYEALEEDYASFIITAYGDANTEVVRLDMPIFGAIAAKNNTTKISAALDKVSQQGYTLTNTTYLNNVDVVVTTYLFTKKQQ